MACGGEGEEEGKRGRVNEDGVDDADVELMM